MKELIGETAGRIWTTLNQNEEVPVSRLPRMLAEKEPVVYQALGWLAREDKITYRNKGKSTYVTAVK